LATRSCNSASFWRTLSAGSRVAFLVQILDGRLDLVLLLVEFFCF